MALLPRTDPRTGTVIWSGDDSDDLLAWLVALPDCPPVTAHQVLRCDGPGHAGDPSGSPLYCGFVAALITILLVGIVLDLVGQGETYTLAGFRAAMSVQYLVWAVGLVGFLRARHAVRTRMAAEGTHVPSVREVLRRRRAARG